MYGVYVLCVRMEGDDGIGHIVGLGFEAANSVSEGIRGRTRVLQKGLRSSIFDPFGLNRLCSIILQKQDEMPKARRVETITTINVRLFRQARVYQSLSGSVLIQTSKVTSSKWIYRILGRQQT